MNTLIAIMGLCGSALFGFIMLDPTTPYVLKPISISTAPTNSPIGHIVEPDDHTLRICSSNYVFAVVEPGRSFHYEILWFVSMPRIDQSDILMEYRFDIPKYAAEHIKPLGAEVPDNISRTARIHEKYFGQQGGPGYPPQGVGSPDP